MVPLKTEFKVLVLRYPTREVPAGIRPILVDECGILGRGCQVSFRHHCNILTSEKLKCIILQLTSHALNNCARVRVEANFATYCTRRY